MWHYAESNEYPQTVDSTSSKNWVYVRRNIEEFEREDETDPTIKKKFYRWEEMKIRKEDYLIHQLEQTESQTTNIELALVELYEGVMSNG